MHEQMMDYQQYRELMNRLAAEGRTTGPKQSEALGHYTKMNAQRMKRLDKTLQLNEALLQALDQVDEDWIWLVLTEAWCGDAAQNIPVMARAAEYQPRIELRLILRDDHPEIMDRYALHGSRSIPRLVCFRRSDEAELGTWGPRPAPAQQMVMDNKQAASPRPYSQLSEEMQKWYANDKTQTLQAELAEAIQQWLQKSRQG